jgi:hypothetical protein
MRHGKKVLALLLMLALLASLGATALADDGEDAVIVAEEGVIEGETENETKGEPETEEKLTVKCVDAEGKTIRDKKEDYLDLSKDLVVDEKYTRPEIENYTYQKMKVGEDEIEKLTVTHKDGKAVITVTIGEGEEAKEKTLTGSETLVFAYAQTVVPHEHSWDDGKVTKEATCTEKGEKSLKAAFTNSAFAEQSKTAEIPALGHDFAHGRCKRCDGIDPNFKPKLTDNTNGHASWGTDYKVTSDAARKDFQKLLIDGQEIASSNYSVAEVNGNTVVTVKGSAIKTLKVGQHSIAIVSQTGTAQRNFSVSDKPKTGDETAALWTGLLLLSALGCGAVTLTARKKFSAQ